MKDTTFRKIVVTAIAVTGIIVVHDIGAKWWYEHTFKSRCELSYNIQVHFWKRGSRDTQPTHAEIEAEERLTTKPSTWLF